MLIPVTLFFSFVSGPLNDSLTVRLHQQAIEKTLSHGRKEVQKLGLQKKARGPLESVINKTTISSTAKQANAAKMRVSSLSISDYILPLLYFLA